MKHIKKMNEYNSDKDILRYQVWEIISFKNKETGEIVNEVPENDIPVDNKYGIKYHKDGSKYSIYSVERTTDGEIFTIGDEIGFVYNDNSFGKITQMYINGIQLVLEQGNGGFPLTDDVRKI